MKAAWTRFALFAACTGATACVVPVTDGVGTETSELTVEAPDEPNCEGSTYYVGTANGGVWKTFNAASRAGEAHSGERDPGEIDCESAEGTHYVGGANGGVWKTTNGASSAGEADDEADAGPDDFDGRDVTTETGMGDAGARGVTYGPVITIKPKG